jgi:hypothetical protein
MSEIEPCPFCGDPMRVHGQLLQHVDQGTCVIGAQGWPREYLDRWNTRSQSERVSRLEEALKALIYETTHLSPCEVDGSHRCTISGAALDRARSALNQSDGGGNG